MANSPDRDDLLSGNERLLVAAAVGVLLLVILFAGVLGGFGGIFSAVFFLLYTAVSIAVVVLVLWFLYRIAVGVERIADAQERMVRTNEISARSEHGPSGAGRTDRGGQGGQNDRMGRGDQNDRTDRDDRNDRSGRH